MAKNSSEERNVFFEHSMQLPVAQGQQVIEKFAPDTAARSSVYGFFRYSNWASRALGPIPCRFLAISESFRAKSPQKTSERICRTKAHYPYCSYNSNWSCPFPPAENRLKVRIEAGEKNAHE